MTQPRRVAITGLGACSALGTGVDKLWSGLIEGRSGIAPITAFDASNLRSRIAGEVSDFDPSVLLPRELMKRSARFTQLALVAAREAIAQATFDEQVDRERVAVIVGSGEGDMIMLESEHSKFEQRGPGKYHPLTIPMIIPNMAAASIAVDHGLLGPNMAIATACASGANSIGTALDLIRAGRADAAVAGSSEAVITGYTIDGYCQLRALSTRNDDPAGASRPFSLDRDGFVAAEGAGILVLEEWEHAERRGVTILAELAGYGASGDGYHITAPHPDGRGAVSAMRAAIEDAGLTPEDFQVINAHGTSTQMNDSIESRAIREVFGAHADSLAVHSTKSMIGHCMGGAGSIEAVVAVKTLLNGIVHPTINLQTPDPECDLDYVPEGARNLAVDAVLSNSFGFGGHNGVLAFRRHPH